MQALLLPLFEQLPHEFGDGVESDLASLGTGCEGERRCQVRLAGSAVSDDEDVLRLGGVLPGHQLTHKGLVDRRLRLVVGSAADSDRRLHLINETTMSFTTGGSYAKLEALNHTVLLVHSIRHTTFAEVVPCVTSSLAFVP